MMNFIRNHQKKFFLFITVFIVFSFVFFGTSGVIDNNNKPKDHVIGKAIDGSLIHKSELDVMTYFLSSDIDTIFLGGQINTLNDGVIAKDIIKTNVADLIVDSYFDQIKNDMAFRYEKAKRISLYSHPEAKELSSENVWKLFCPKINKSIEELKQQKELNKDFVKALFNLYDAQKDFSPEMLRRVLFFQQKQNSKINPDPFIMQGDFSLLGYKSINEWLGNRFINLASQFIINTSVIAEKKGYKVTNEEILLDLHKNADEGFKKVKYMLNLSLPSGEDAFHYQLKILGMSEKNVLNIWKKVLLVRKYFNDVANNIFVDEASFQEISDCKKEKADIALYSLPENLKLKSFRDLAHLCMYNQAVTSSCEIDLQDKFNSIEDIEKNYPLLVSKTYDVSMAKTTLEEVALQIGEKKLWDWQVEDNNWKSLCDKFSKISDKKDKSRFDILEDLTFKMRNEVDMFSRIKMVQEDIKMVKNYLLASNKKTISITLNDFINEMSIDDIKNKEDIVKLFKKALIDNSKEALEKLNFYTEDEKAYYSFNVIPSKENKQIVTFEKAKKDKIIDFVLDQYLEKNLDAIKQKHSDIFTENSSPSKNVLYACLFDDLMEKLEVSKSNYKDSYLEILPSKFLVKFMENRKNGIQNNNNDKSFIWNLHKVEMTITKESASDWIKDYVFVKKTEGFSPVHLKENEEVEFLYVKDRKIDTSELENKIANTRQALGDEAKKELAEKVFNDIKEYIFEDKIIAENENI